MKVALFKTTYGTFLSFEFREDEGANNDVRAGYPRCTEWVDVEFPPLPVGDVIAAEITLLDAQIKRVTEEWHKAVAVINDRKRELLSLTHTPDVL